MPDFSQDEGGWGIGKAASDVKFRLVVYEEYDDGFVSTFVCLHDLSA